jgi:hypothetical protein
LAGLVGIATPKVDGRDLTDLLLRTVPNAKRIPSFASARSATAASTADSNTTAQPSAAR